VINAGSTVSRLSIANVPALFARAANLLIDSVLAFSRNVASWCWNEESLNVVIGIVTAQPGKSHCKAFCDARTSSERGDASKASKRTTFSPCALSEYQSSEV
jgi:hypothetical protein